MKLHRRQFFRLATGVAALPIVSHVARAQTYPARAVRLVIPWPAGGPADISGRLIGQWLSETLGQPFLIENRPGAGGSIGTEVAVKSPPDGYTLLLIGSFNAINAALYDKLNFSFVRDIAPVASIMRNPLVMEVNPSVPARTLPEFIAYAKANPGKINMASGGNGSPQHVAGELFKMMAGVDMVHVPYRGSAPMLTDLIAGQVHVTFDPMLASLEHIKAGTLRPLAVTTAARVEALPDVPTVSEYFPGYEASGWTGIGLPMGTAGEIAEKLNREINAALVSPKVKERLADLGGTAFATSPTEFGNFIADEIQKFAKVVKFAGITPD
jgi:tripartite-type tricarboxylate transporter receptor subunit TctC